MEILRTSINQLQSLADLITKIIHDETPQILIEAAIKAIKCKCFTELPTEDELEEAILELQKQVATDQADDISTKMGMLKSFLEKYINKNKNGKLT